VSATPPIGPLRDLVARLEDAGLVCALGGSGLLVALGLAREAHDWDLTTDAPRARLEALFPDQRPAHVGSGGVHADQKLVFEASRIECIIGFAFHVTGAVVRIPTRVTGRWQDVPVGSPEAWAVAYTLLGRAPKADLLFAHLERRGADPEITAALLAQPLPAPLANRLRALPRRPASDG
jgi:hypothetical protein